jgi:sugar/nucleoside kinase (ribokinase family)
MDSSHKNKQPIITIGSGNIEYILMCEGEIELGRKHLIKPIELIGGSCVNYTMRLICAGYNVFPIPLIGNDQNGLKIRKQVVNAARLHQTPEKTVQYMRAADFLIDGLCTPKTTVVIHNGRRTIFSAIASESSEVKDHVLNRLKTAFRYHTDLSHSIMIGHIAQDRDDLQPGAITKSIIDAYADKAFLFANFGNGQLQHGVDLWQDDLNRLDLMQLNLGEIRRLFGYDPAAISLPALLKWLQTRSISAVITLGRLGAVGTYRDGRDGIVLAWPLKTGKPADPTGAGDAFAAGMVASLQGNKKFSFDDFKTAIETGRLWSSYACATLGASGKCPTSQALAEYASKHHTPAENDIQIANPVCAERILTLFDKAY